MMPYSLINVTKKRIIRIAKENNQLMIDKLPFNKQDQIAILVIKEILLI